MNRQLAVLALFVTLAGCAKDKPGNIEVFRTCAPPEPSSKGGCAWAATCSTAPLDTYVIDAAGTNELFVGVQVNNQLPDNTNEGTGHVNTNNAFVDTYVVDYAVHGAAVSIPGISGPAQIQNVVPAGGSAVVGVRLMDLDITTSAALQAAAAASASGTVRVTATMKLKGVLGDSSTFETAERTYGVDVCAGCLGPPGCSTGSIPAACPSYYQWPSTPACLTPP